MKIYFAGSISGGRGDAELYAKIIKLLKNYGDVLTEHVGNPNLTATGEEISEEEIFNRDASWLAGCDVVVAEVTQPSLGVGFELFLGHTLGKKTICLFREQPGKRLSAIIAANKAFIIKRYKSLEDLPAIFDETLKR
jgi:hypothetical protein